MPSRPLRWFEYRQNNSGGWFQIDDAVSVTVYIQAADATEANERAEGLGIYFGGEGDCECCGDRWYPADSGEEDFPTGYRDGDWSTTRAYRLADQPVYDRDPDQVDWRLRGSRYDAQPTPQHDTVFYWRSGARQYGYIPSAEEEAT